MLSLCICMCVCIVSLSGVLSSYETSSAVPPLIWTTWVFHSLLFYKFKRDILILLWNFYYYFYFIICKPSPSLSCVWLCVVYPRCCSGSCKHAYFTCTSFFNWNVKRNLNAIHITLVNWHFKFIRIKRHVSYVALCYLLNKEKEKLRNRDNVKVKKNNKIWKDCDRSLSK